MCSRPSVTPFLFTLQTILVISGSNLVLTTQGASPTVERLLHTWMQSPLHVEYSVEFHVDSPIDKTDWNQTQQILFQRDGETVYAQEQVSIDNSRRLQMDTLFRDGEVVRFQTDWAGDELRNKTAVFVSPNVASSVGPTGAGDIFNMNSHCPPVGCIDGFFVDKYFPNQSIDMVVDENGGISITAVTDLGKAQAWFKPDLSPVRVLVEKQTHHLTTGSRTIGEVNYNNQDPNSRLTGMTFEVKDFALKPVDGGGWYVAACELAGRTTSGRGLENIEASSWKIQKVDFDPSLQDGKVYPLVPLEDQESVTVEQAAQLPFHWSVSERWVVPSSSQLVGTASPRFGRTGVFLTFLFLLLVLAILKVRTSTRGS